MAVATVTANRIESGPGRLYYLTLATALPTFTAAASKVAATYTGCIEVGATDAGITYTEATETADITVAENLYPVRTVVTSKSSRIAVTLNEIHDLNWQLAMNGGTATSSGAGVTKLTTYVPPLVGAEVRSKLIFVSNNDLEVLVWPQVLNVGSVEYVRGTYETKAGLSLEFNAEIPSNEAGYVTPYKRYTAGALSIAP